LRVYEIDAAGSSVIEHNAGATDDSGLKGESKSIPPSAFILPPFAPSLPLTNASRRRTNSTLASFFETETDKMMNKIALKLGLIALACAICGISTARAADQPAAAPAQSARAVTEKVIQSALAILRDKSLSTDEKRQKVQQIAYDNMSFEVMGKLSLGRYYRGLTDAQKAQYQKEFKELVTNTYGHTTDDYTDEDVKVTADRAEQDGDATVTTHITGTKDGKSGQDVATVDYRLRKTEGQWKVIDFTIDGVSIVNNYRSQFQDIMTSGGIEQLLKQLHDKNAANAK